MEDRKIKALHDTKDSFVTWCVIKWNISYKNWQKIYYLPSDYNYNKVKINIQKWEKWFCSIQEAEKNWFIRVKNIYKN